MLRTFIEVLFSDNRGRYNGKSYIYEVACNADISPKDIIHITSLKDGATTCVYTPSYFDKNILVTNKVVLDMTDDIDAQIYWGIAKWKRITGVDIVSKFKDMDKEPLDNADILKPLKAAKYDPDENTLFISEKDLIKGGGLYVGADVVSSGTYLTFTNTNNEITEARRMKTNMFDGIMKNFQFGKIDTDKIAYSLNGLAFKDANGDYVVYNADGSATNVSSLAFQMPLFAMPTPLAQIEQGDVIVHNKANEYVIVKEVTPTAIIAIAPNRNEIITIVPQKSIFGFDFYTKIVSPMSMMAGNATNDNPFGNFLPFMLMGDNMDNDTMLMLMMMNGGAMNQNMLLPMMLMKDGDNDKSTMLMLMMMNGGNLFGNKGE